MPQSAARINAKIGGSRGEFISPNLGMQRKADLTACAPTEAEPISNSATIEIQTATDSLSMIWVLALLVAWHFTAGKECAGKAAAMAGTPSGVRGSADA